MLFKVYAQNVNRPTGKAITEATKDDLARVFNEIIDEAINANMIDVYTKDGDIDSKKYSAAYEIIEAYWQQNKVISSGDYEIIEALSMDDIRRPCKCESDTNIIF